MNIWEGIFINAYRETHFSFCFKIHVLDMFPNQSFSSLIYKKDHYSADLMVLLWGVDKVTQLNNLAHSYTQYVLKTNF